MNRKAIRRIPLEKLFDLKVDFAFKQMFGNEKNKKITVVFLNAVLKLTGRDTIKEVTFLKHELGGEYQDDKQSRLDILVKTQNGDFINVEIQLSNQHDMTKRTLYYWAKMYESQLVRGMGYSELRPTITINICNFTMFKDNKNYHNTFHLYEDTTLSRLMPEEDVMEIHFIEINKFISLWYEGKLNALEDLLIRWLLLLGMVDGRNKKVYAEIYRELEELAMKDENLRAAFDTWEEISQSPETILAYQSRLKYILDEEARYIDGINKGREQGKAEGMKEGLEQGLEQGRKQEQIELVKKLMKRHVTVEEIMDLVGLSREEIERIKDLDLPQD
ncbi:Rpn family recombination-promoting nuclease/putative transposase [Lysinibacillus sp. G4S2]|uniref:Rpn family recombination-promoting nuclease/putative transposase n=1 Tax=Lysinibacillus sp. G4S2 TaxID=3055859 RepID=UPI0025A21A1C|nr:Rpn family recombination-promoting nuclease/putative transposase [Lysinibacillus sp. G4S2]MDM5248199.1 Rpn family recombination-promoting nuclease/putative transposase [Lysinibacillus sp. G4S2]